MPARWCQWPSKSPRSWPVKVPGLGLADHELVVWWSGCRYKQHGASYGCIKGLGYYPLVATHADTGDILHACPDAERVGQHRSGHS